MKLTFSVFTDEQNRLVLQNTHATLIIEQSKLLLREDLSNIGFVDVIILREGEKRRITIILIDSAGMTQTAIFEGVFEIDQIVSFALSLLTSVFKG